MSKTNAVTVLLVTACLATSVSCKRKGGPANDGLATLTAAAQRVAALETPEAESLANETPLSDGTLSPATAFALTQQASGVDVEALLAASPPLATFTPSAARGPDGQLLYVRNGHFFRGNADGSGITAVQSDGLPAVWAPPDDPGQAFAAPDRSRVAFFGGRDAELWVMDPDGRDAEAVTGPNIPSGAHEIAFGTSRGTVRLQPGQDYTVALMPAGGDAVSLFVDDNRRHVKGEGRLRVIHVSPAAQGKSLTVIMNESQAPRAIPYGKDSGDIAVQFGSVNLELRDENNERVGLFPGLTLGERELKTVFLYGNESVQASEASYEPSEPPSGASRVRVFNATGQTATVRLDDSLVIAADVAAGAVSPYAAVNATAGSDEMAAIERSIYGLDTGTAPVAWSPDGRHIAFLAAPDGRPDLYLATPGGETRRLSNDPNTEMAPAWSPDSGRLVWTALDSGFDVHKLYSYKVGDSAAKVVDTGPVISAAGLAPDTAIVIPEGAGWIDNDRVYFYPVVAGISTGIWMAEVDDDRVEPVMPKAIESGTWSAEAGRWAVTVENSSEVDVVSPDGAVTQIATSAASAPHWSPDGRLLSWVDGASDSPDGWQIHVANADGSNDRVVTDRQALLQASPPVAGPRAKRVWIDDGRSLVYSRAGRDYAAAERAGSIAGKAGEDIENLWVVSVDGGEPRRMTDLVKSFYVKELTESPEDNTLALVAFSYLDRTQKLWAVGADGGKPVAVDSGVRWYMWLP